MIVSNHAAQRWKQRFPMHDIQAEYGKAVPITPKQRKKLRKTCNSHRKYMTGGDKGVRFMVADGEIVFVVGGDGVIITVLDLSGL